MRLIMSDSSHLPCPNCTDFERWYNFNYILDLDVTLGEIHVPLKGSTDATPGTLQLTGWSGGSGNRQLDTDHIKGFALEFSLDSQGDIGSTTAGVIDPFGLSALVSHTNLSGAENSGKAVVETGLHFNAVSARFHRREFLGSQCQKTCNHDPYCLYALSNERKENAEHQCILVSAINQVGFASMRSSHQLLEYVKLSHRPDAICSYTIKKTNYERHWNKTFH